MYTLENHRSQNSQQINWKIRLYALKYENIENCHTQQVLNTRDTNKAY